MNKVILTGNLTKDVELSETNSGIKVARFTLAVQRRFANADGEREADFINIIVWRTQAENCHKYLKKGSKAAVIGTLQTRNYEADDGTKRYVTEVVADTFNGVSFLSRGNGAGNGGNSYNGGGADYSHSSNDVFGGMKN